PVTIYRPCSVVGDSGTGEVDRFDGPYALALWVSMSGGALPLPFLGEGGAPLNVVPVDFVIQAVWQLSRDPRALGRTLHLVDPNPMSTRRAYELVAEKLNRRVPRFRIPTGAANAVLRLPFWERVAGPQRVALRAVNHMAVYNCNNVLELLDGTGIRCPPLPSYLDALVAFVREVYRRPKEVGPEADAPPRVADPRSLPRRPRSHAQ
ncbi:MAG TPA: SDR family oxidoreductase, partial [Myxococcaceae bacterium]|nr:SDR family oxidoreductase [Myxococcaceae bacterium]